MLHPEHGPVRLVVSQYFNRGFSRSKYPQQVRSRVLNGRSSEQVTRSHAGWMSTFLDFGRLTFSPLHRCFGAPTEHQRKP
jgi:hypothetical protein